MLEKKGRKAFYEYFPFFRLWKILVFFIKMLTFLNNFVMKHLLLLLMIVLQSYIAISQNEISPLAREVYNKTTDYVRQKGWTAEISGNCLEINGGGEDTYEIYVSKDERPVLFFRSVATIDESKSIPDLVKAVNIVNVWLTGIKCTVSLDGKVLVIAYEQFINSSGEVVKNFDIYTSQLKKALNLLRRKYQEVFENNKFQKLSLPFVVYTSNMFDLCDDKAVLSDYCSYPSSQTCSIGVTFTAKGKGVHDIGVKLINPQGMVYSQTGELVIDSDPSKYTFETQMELEDEITDYFIGSWGSTAPGFFTPGQYRFEYYYKNQLFYICRFEIL